MDAAEHLTIGALADVVNQSMSRKLVRVRDIEAAAIRRIRTFGLPAPVTQHEVFAPDGSFVARLDMAWPDERVAREYDADRFHGPERTEHDEMRAQRLEALGWRIGTVHRRNLRPSDVGWLHDLRRDLARRRRTAS